MPRFEAAGVAVYALSYDEPDALRDFRDAHGITFTLLSDPQSEIIRAFGILNELIDADDHPWFGIPYPGTYVTDAQGQICAKFFEHNLAVRAGPEQMLRAVRGEALDAHGPAEAPAEVEFDVFLDGAALAPTVQRDLVVRFRVPEGRHVYALPAPAGSRAVEVVLEANPALVVRAVQRPAADEHQLAGTDEVFPVHHGTFELRLPLTVNRGPGKDFSAVVIRGEVHWQVCDDAVCDIPVSRRFELSVLLGNAPLRAIGDPEGMALEPNAMTHFAQMTARRK